MKIGLIQPPPPRILLYGKAGSGKSALSYTLGGHAQCFDFERGWESGRTLQDQFTSVRREVDIAGPVDKKGMPIGYVDLDTTKPSAFLTFKSDIIKVADQITKGTYPYKALIIDSLTTLAEAAMRNILHNQGQKWAGVDISTITKGFIQIQHWGFLFTDILNVLSIIRSFPIVVVMLAHTKVSEEISTVNIDGKLQATRREIIELGISGKDMPDKVPSYFEEFWYMKTRSSGGNTIQRVIQTMNDSLIQARTRLNLPNDLDTSIGLPEILKKAGFEFEI
jgi:hypothetical protein